MATHHKAEQTLVIVKPDGIQRNLIGEIIKRYERSGLKLVAIKMLVPTEDMVEKHYTVDPEWVVKTGLKTIESYKKKGKVPPSEDPLEITAVILRNLKKYMTMGPVVAMVWEGIHAVQIVRKLTGATEPLTSDVGTIRGDYTIDSYEVSDVDARAVRNLVHASGSPEEAQDEIKLWFAPHEVIEYKILGEEIIYDPKIEQILSK